MKDAIKEKVFTAIGEASMCWEPRPTGVFDSTAAQKIGERLAADLASAVEDEPKDCGFTLATCPYERCSGITMRKPVEVEPLAVLADRKGFNIQSNNLNGPRIFIRQRINFLDGRQEMIKVFEANGDNMTECEAKARAFLAGLPDRPTKGEGE